MDKIARRYRSWRPGVVHLIVGAWLLIALAACQPERAVAVTFPDDPRVLDGAWTITTTGLASDVGRTVLSADGQRLLLTQGQRAWLYHRGSDGTWSEGDAAPYAAHLQAQEDPSLDALVALERSGREVAVTILSLADASLTSSTVTLPAGLNVKRLTVGSGRLFALLSGEGGAQQLHWFDLATGAAAGSHTVPNHEDGMRESSNGRMLSFWDVRAGHLWLLDTAQPSVPLRYFDMGIFCRGVGPGESSDDGRWFLAIHCADNLRVLDLNEPDPKWRAAGVKEHSSLRFAHGANDLVVWHDDAGRVRAHDLSGSGTTTLASDLRSGGFFPPGVLRVNVPAGLVLADDGEGQVAVLPLDDTEAGTTLPLLPLERASLNLNATDPYSISHTSGYKFSGTFEAEGQGGEPLKLEGSVFSDRFHDYVTTAAIPPPRLDGRAEARPAGASDDEEALYRLEFSSEDRNAVAYSGSLYDAANDLAYRVRLAATLE